MAKAGAITGRFARGATAQQVEFASALRELHRMIAQYDPCHRTLKAICKQLNVSEQHLSNFLHAERLPTKEEAEALFRLAEAALPEATAVDSAAAMPCGLDELLRLRALAVRPCERCRTWHDAMVAQGVDGYLAVRLRADTANGAGVPVPRREWDRHPGPEPLPTQWADIEEVRQLSAHGLEAELLNLLGHLGTHTEPDALPPIMRALRSEGMDEAADAVVDAAAARPLPVVLEIASELHGSGLREALGRLLSTARAYGRN